MKFNTINPKNFSIYKPLIPDIFESIIYDVNIIPFGIGDGNKAYGVMICEIQDHSQLMLRWICVADGYRRHGIASIMYNSFCLILKNKGYKQLNVVLEDTELFDDLFLFLNSKSNTSFFMITDDLVRIKAFDLNNVLENNNIISKNVKPIDGVPSYKITEAIKKADETPLLERQYRIKDYVDASAVITDGEKITGLFLCKKGINDHDYELTYFVNYSKSALNLMKMIKFSAENLLSVDKDATITITTVNEFAKKIAVLTGDMSTKVVLSGCVCRL